MLTRCKNEKCQEFLSDTGVICFSCDNNRKLEMILYAFELDPAMQGTNTEQCIIVPNVQNALQLEKVSEL